VAYGPQGYGVALQGPAFDRARDLGYRIVCTEWNWNGWGMQPMPVDVRHRHLPMAQALGTAAFLHGLMRQGDDVDLAVQSMLLGSRWGIAAIMADPAGAWAPFFQPQGMTAALYRRYHGARRLALRLDGVPSVPQPYIVGNWTKWPQGPDVPVLPLIDAVATADDDEIHVHLLQRHVSEALAVHIDLSATGVTTSTGRWRSITASDAEAAAQKPQRPATSSQPVALVNGRMRIDLPPRSVSIITVPR
jgi:alpha-L-arabinofuranosidase